MSSPSPNSPKYSVEARDARGINIGDRNIIYQYFIDDPRYRSLAGKLYTFTTLIEEKTRGFIGRQFVFDALDLFLREKDRGYFVVRGEPGIGKTALAAQLVKTRGYVHHFNEALTGIIRADQFLQNVTVQLVARYQLDPSINLSDTGRDGGVLSGLLEEISRRVAANHPLVIVVDALDEAERPFGGRGNVLYLPPRLPRGVYFIATHRPIEDFPLSLETVRQYFYLEADSQGNLLDVRHYLEQVAGRLQNQLRQRGIHKDRFIQVLSEKSEGNFMYLDHVVRKFQAGEYADLALDELPQGLMDYYERHWRQMRAMDEDLWLETRQPIICFLAAAQEPVTVEELASFARLTTGRVMAALRDWREFLSIETGTGRKRFRIYHASFQDFLQKKDEVGEIDLAQIHSTIADQGIDEWKKFRGK